MKQYSVAFRPANRRGRIAKFEWFNSEFARNANAAALKRDGYKVRKLTRIKR